MEREGMRVVAHGEKWCRPQPDSRKSVHVAAENGPSVFERRFWLFACGAVVLWICLRVFDFTLLPPAYNGLLITQPFCGLHSWDLADRAWAARSHVKYGLGYTRGLRTLVVGDPPPLIPEYYVSHPPLGGWGSRLHYSLLVLTAATRLSQSVSFIQWNVEEGTPDGREDHWI
jgi:hypothetical protein